jgi:hypothetical protein
MSLTQLTAYLAAAGVPRSRKELQRRCIAGRMGAKLGTQWVVKRREADALVEQLRAKK